MTLVLLPSVRLAVRLPAVRLALVLLVALPAWVAWWGEDADAGLRLRLVGAATAVALALVWGDRAALMVSATPVGLPAVQRGRVVVVAGLLVCSWSAAAVAATWTASGVALGPAALESVGLSLVLCALIGAVSRNREGEPVGAYPVPVLLGLVLLHARGPESWRLLLLGPESGAVQRRWLVALAAALVVLWVVTRDPGAPRLRAAPVRR